MYWIVDLRVRVGLSLDGDHIAARSWRVEL